VADSVQGYLFETKLVGLDSRWNPPDTYGIRDYYRLPSGRYEFWVHCVDVLGRAGPSTSYRFRQLAPWHRRWPAWTAFGALAAGAIWGGYRWRARRLRRQNEQLNRMVEERTRELSLANSAKMDFLASISHEIRNPLSGVTGLVAILRTSALGARESELARSLDACARSLRRVFDEVLGFARLEQGHVSLHVRPFRLRELLEEIVSVSAAEAALRGNRLTLRLDPPDAAFLGDDGKIRTIIGNFVTNALKYAPGKPVEIEAHFETQGADRMLVSIQVCDDGPGIPSENSCAAAPPSNNKNPARGSGWRLARPWPNSWAAASAWKAPRAEARGFICN